MTIPLDFDKVRFYKLLSAFQNRIRDGKVPQAMTIGYNLWSMNHSAYWNRCQIIAVEDCVPETLPIVNALRSWYDSLKAEGQGDEGRMGVLKAAQVLAQSKKDRMADELLHVILRLPDKAAEWSAWEDKDIVPHMSRGYRYFVETKSATSNQSESYAEWRRFWLTLMKNVKE